MSAPLVPFRLGPQPVRVLLADLRLRPADVLVPQAPHSAVLRNN